MKSAGSFLLTVSRRFLWAVMVAYMLAIHNFYREDDQTPDTIGVVEEVKELPGENSVLT